MSAVDYHLRELSIARDRADPAHILPRVPTAARKILDVGCGIGQTLVALELGPDVSCYGVDLDRDSIEYGRQHFPDLKLEIASGEQLPYPAESFDFLICRVALPYMNVPRAVREFHRVLAPGGKIWISFHPPRLFRKRVHQAIRKLDVKDMLYVLYVFANSAALFLSGKQFYLRLGQARCESFQTFGMIKGILAKAGFTQIGLTNEQFSVVEASKPIA